MTVFNFPDTSGKPTDGTFTWTAPNGLLYSWDGDAWRTIGGGGGGNASITITDDLSTIPAPDAGDLAWHTIEARMYIYYQDDDSQQWVDASPAGDSDSLWERIGTTLQPAIDGDSVNIGSGSITLNTNGSGVFKSNVIVDKPAVNKAFITQLSGVETASISSDGSATFAGNVAVSRSVSEYNSFFNFGGIAVSISDAATFDNDVFTIDRNPSNTRLITFKSDGSATFGSGNITLGADGLVNTKRIAASSTPIARFTGLVDANNERGRFEIFGDGSTRGRNIVFNLEPDDPANYTTTMVDGEEQQVYSGPTLDVKEKLLDFVTRIEALEAEVQALKGGN